MSSISEIPEKEVLTESDLWQKHEPAVWKAERFEGPSHFYPVYRWNRYYSHSPFLLAQLKGGISLNPVCERYLTKLKHAYAPPDLLIDREIERIGGPRPFSCELTDLDPFLKKLCRAIQNDVSSIEAQNPSYTNFILCGGRDSLNGLLLNWNNPSVAVSAEPDYEFVRDFIWANDLPFDLIKITDSIDATLLDREVAETFCRIDLRHVRWLPDLVQLGKDVKGRAVFWKGSLGDVYFTPHWMKYTGNRTPMNAAYRKRYRRWTRRAGMLRKLGWQLGIRADVERAFWLRGSAWQGTQHGIYRAITGCLVASLYHGPEASAVLHSADLSELVYEDIRATMGAYLAEKPVAYPSTNPALPESGVRGGLSSVERFVESVKRLRVEVSGQEPDGCP